MNIMCDLEDVKRLGGGAHLVSVYSSCSVSLVAPFNSLLAWDLHTGAATGEERHMNFGLGSNRRK